MTKKKLTTVIIISVVLLCMVSGIFAMLLNGTSVTEISVPEATKLLNDSFDSMADGKKALVAIAERNDIAVNSIAYGEEKDIILDCSVRTVDVHTALSAHYAEFMSVDAKKKDSTMFKSALDFKMDFEDKITDIIENAEETEQPVTIIVYDTKDDLEIYSSEEVVNCIFGGILDVKNEISQIKTIETTDESGKKTEKTLESANINKGFIQCIEAKFDSTKPDASSFVGKMVNSIKRDFQRNFMEHDRWKTVLAGLWTTIKLTFFSLLIGVFLGFIIAFIRCTYLKSRKPGFILKILNWIMELYLTVIRGTPVVVQIMIIYFVIFMPVGVDKFLSAVICFGLNSGAYVAEIVRGGIMSIDEGQTEAGRSLGFNYIQTMYHIVFPQAFKAVLPALANEFVVLLKETSIAFYIGLGDLMYSVNAIRAATYSPFMPLVAAALIYLVMVLALSKLVSILERRLRNSER